MSNFKISGIKISGISCAVPKNESPVVDDKFSKTTGVYNRRIASYDIKTSDLCIASANKLISDLNICIEDIGVLVFVSQTPNYKLPVTSAILQTVLKIPQSCVCIDIPLGCSGYVYGLSVVSSLIKTIGCKYGLLLVGDTISKIVDFEDSSTNLLFGDAGSCTILENDSTSSDMYFHLGTDGTGYECIIQESDLSKLKLNGIDVFNFGISKIPKIVNSFISKENIDINLIDLFVFHQANKMMNDKIYSKLKIPEHKTITSLHDFGNTSSTTIPLTIINEIDKFKNAKKVLFCGFGVGLSWGIFYTDLNYKIHCSKLIEI